MKSILTTGLATVALCSVWANPAAAFELSGFLATEARGFAQSGAFAEQTDGTISLVAQPELYRDWKRGDHAVLVVPFARWDLADDERTHVDLREAYWQWAARSWELRVGVQKAFWGVAESNHLIDILNQTDLVENVDQEDKLGQPMVWWKWIGDFGTLDFHLMTGFRERTFPGAESRLRTPLLVDADAARYESGAERANLDWAVRWSRYVGDWDFGLAHFQGNSREPRFLAEPNTAGDLRLIPFYDQIDQTSLDAQFTRGGWIVKLEALRRSGQGDTYTAAVGGFEYTLVGLFGSVYDLGLLAEWHWDERDEEAPTPFENDLFVGGRFVLNDVQSSELLAGAIVDAEGDGVSWLLEASRRLGDRWKLSVEARGVTGADEADPLSAFARDDYLQVELARYF